MSGGVDSSVAAAMLVADGHELTGVHMKLSEESIESGGRVHGCCTVEAADDARRVAQVLDIPFYVWNLRETFSRTVIADFVDEYARGRTPNPCVRCNETVKFGALLDRGRALGFDAVATGHYAVVSHEGASPRLFRGADRAKDQSYVLSTVDREGLAFARFPLGAQTKERTRKIARSLALRTADKPESYDICFVPDGDAGAFVERRGVAAQPGPVLDPEGREIGEHSGVHRYTVGQRKGLGLATHERRYVLDIDATRNAIVVGPGELLSRRGLVAEHVSWLVADVPADCEVQIRAHGEPIPSRIDRPSAGEARVMFSRPERGVAPGQVVAFYDGDEVLGGGTIAAAF
jgi:tRNA-specific 2-thiouridylase